MALATTNEQGDLMIEGDHQALEEAGVGFDPATQALDLTKEEKRRTTALLLAINAYKELIIKDAAYLREVADMARRNEGPQIKAATIDAMVIAAIKFDNFISGNPDIPVERIQEQITRSEQVEEKIETKEESENG